MPKKKKLVLQEMSESKKAELEDFFENIRMEAKKKLIFFITRTEAQALGGYSISTGTLANLDSSGEGVEGLFYMGKKACYPLDNYIDFLKRRAGL